MIEIKDYLKQIESKIRSEQFKKNSIRQYLNFENPTYFPVQNYTPMPKYPAW